MPQHSTSSFGRGWIPGDRDIGLPGEERPSSPLPPAGGAGGGFEGSAAFASAHPNPSRMRARLMPALPFTPDRRVRFLHLLASTGNVRRACQAVGVSPQAAYVHKRRDGAFAAGWSAALILARDAAEEVLAERALNGTEETIFYRGEAVGSRVRFDARLLLAHLARLDAHAEQALAEGQAATGIAARFDEYLAELRGGDAAGSDPAFAPPEDDPEGPPRWTPAQQARADVCRAAREAALYAFPPRVEDLPAEALAELDLAATDPLDLWSEALGRAQRKAEAAAAAAWDAEAATRLEALDSLFQEDEASPRMGCGEAASCCDEDGVLHALIPAEPPVETKSAKGPLDCVNRVNLPAGRPARASGGGLGGRVGLGGGGQRMKSSAVSAPSAARTKNLSGLFPLLAKSVTAQVSEKTFAGRHRAALRCQTAENV